MLIWRGSSSESSSFLESEKIESNGIHRKSNEKRDSLQSGSTFAENGHTFTGHATFLWFHVERNAEWKLHHFWWSIDKFFGTTTLNDAVHAWLLILLQNLIGQIAEAQFQWHFNLNAIQFIAFIIVGKWIVRRCGCIWFAVTALRFGGNCFHVLLVIVQRLHVIVVHLPTGEESFGFW